MSKSTTVAFTPPGHAPPARSNRLPWLNLALLIATAISTMFAGTVLAYTGVFGTVLPPLVAGFLFAATLLLILGTHELGHYFMARYHKVETTLPYFIPVPIGLGTFGAFIRMRSPVPHRRALFDVGLAGPIAGLVVAIPLFVVGLLLAPVQYHANLYGGGLLMRGLIFAVAELRNIPPGHTLLPHPIGFAAYVGLFITAVNLLPAGQLDGGHVAYALFGRRSILLGFMTVVGLFALGYMTGWISWYLWAALIAIFGLRHPPTYDDGQPLQGVRWLFGLLALLVLVLIFATNPFPLFR